MTLTLDVRGDQTFVVAGDGRPVALVQPDTYGGTGWSAWLANRNCWDPSGYDYVGSHSTREQALSKVGWLGDGR